MLKSKILWTQIVTIIAILASMFGFDLTAENQAALVTVIGLLDGLVTMAFRKWFNHANTAGKAIQTGGKGLAMILLLPLLIPLALVPSGCANGVFKHSQPITVAEVGIDSGEWFLDLDEEIKCIKKSASGVDKDTVKGDLHPPMWAARNAFVAYKTEADAFIEQAEAAGTGRIPKPQSLIKTDAALTQKLRDVESALSYYRIRYGGCQGIRQRK